MESALVAVAAGAWASVTRTVKFDVPEPFGVPLMTPVEALSDSPLGRLPEASRPRVRRNAARRGQRLAVDAAGLAVGKRAVVIVRGATWPGSV